MSIQRRFSFAIGSLAVMTITLTTGVMMTTAPEAAEKGLYEVEANSIDGAPQALKPFAGKVALVVNVASQCGYTPQYAGLQSLYEKYKGEGFVVLGFPSNDFGGQEPASNEEIKAFCSSKYGVSFPMFAKVKVVGPSKDPVYSYLVGATGGAEVGWNFEKFLVDREGHVVGRYPSRVTPNDPQLIKDIEKGLRGSAS